MTVAAAHRMTLPTFARISCGFAAAALLACGGGDGDGADDNVLPTQASNEDSGSSSATATTGPSTTLTTADGTADSTGAELPLPVAYRFECIDIQTLGDADGTAFQAGLLEDTWNSDVDDYKLNIIFEVVSNDEAAATGEVAIRSGIGTGPDDQCAEPSSQSEVIAVGFDPATALWAPATPAAPGDPLVCSAAATAGTATAGSYTMALGADVRVFIYAQDTDGTTFNCTADAAKPDAVPVRAVEAELTVAPDGQSVAGQLTGCLLGTEAEELCSCLGPCNPDNMHADCGGCPNGSVPLRSLLLGINPSTRCSDLLGAEAYDLALGFTASALPTVPTTCGG